MLLPIFGATTLAAGIIYPLFLHDTLRTFGVIGREVRSTNNQRCEVIPGLEACEHLWLHEPSGYLYAACSTNQGRADWVPCQDHLNEQSCPTDDYFAVIDTRGTGSWQSRTRKIAMQGLSQINVHGFDVYVSPSHTSEQEPQTHGANSTVEAFDLTIGADSMVHVKTFAADIIRTPNSLAAAGPESFIFTNDHGSKRGHGRVLDLLTKRSDVGFCYEKGCKTALAPISFPNGIIQGDKAGQFWIASSVSGVLTRTELQADGSLVLTDEVKLGYGVDNLSRDSQGNVWAAGFPKLLEIVAHIESPEKTASTVALRISKNQGQSAFYGDKYVVDRALEDDGKKVSGKTVYVHDPKSKTLYAAGLVGPVQACKLA